MYVVGLTGGIASGKSAAAAVLRRLGVVVLDADILAREAVEPGTTAHRQIVASFGDEILLPDGSINRPVLGSIVFANPEKRKLLESIVHPAIRELAERRLEELRQAGERVAVYMAPLLIEVGLAARMDEVWVIHVDERTQLMRLTSREPLSEEEAGRRMRSQMPLEEKRGAADVVIENSGSLVELERQVAEEWGRLMERVKAVNSEE